VVVLALACTVLAAALLSINTSAQGPERVSVLITFSSVPGPADQAAVRAAGGILRYSYRLVPGMAASLPAAAVTALQANPRIVAIEPDGRIEALDAELDLAFGVKRIGSGFAHEALITGANVKVGVVDSGIDYWHPDLAGAYAGGRDFVNSDDDPLDDNGHGTHVSGTIAAADNGVGVVGVAPDVQLYGLKILDAAGQGDWSHAIAALEWAVDNGIQVLNHSYGASQSPGTLVALAFANAAAGGVLNVAAAGNTGDCLAKRNTIGYPARYPDVIAVGATDWFDGRPCYSSSGAELELAAPGDWIASTYPGNDYAYGSGTSMASPHVAGAAALMMSAGVVDPVEVRNILTSTADDLGEAGRDKLFGFGLVNVVGAIELAGPTPPAVLVSLSTDQATYADTDTSAVLTAIVADETGSAISGVGFGSFSTTLDGAAVPVTFSEDPLVLGTYVGTLDISTAGSGSHTVAVQVVELTVAGSDSTSFTVGLPPAPGSVHVPAIVYTSSGGRDGKRHVYITVSVVDENGAAVAGATVTVLVYIDDTAWSLGTGTTNTAGQVTFESKNAPPGTYYTELWGVEAGTMSWDGITPPNTFTK
jgi:subtilisin